MSKLSFDANKVKPQAALDPVPSNWYSAKVVETEVKPTKAQAGKKAGQRLSVTWELVGGEYAGRKVFDGFNIENANPVAQEIGQAQLSALCHAVKVFKFGDTKELHDKVHELKVGFEGPRTDNGESYDARNVYKGCRPVEGAVTPASGAGGKLFPKKPEAPAAAEADTAAVVLVWQPNDGIEADTLFWFSDGVEEKKAEELLAGLADGSIPAETPAMLQSEEGWKTVGDYFTQVEETPAAAEEPAKPAAPAKPAKPTAPAKPAPAEAPAAGKKTAPWRKGGK